MIHIPALGGAASFLSGVAAALLISYPIPENSLFVCFVAIFVMLTACLCAAAAIVLYAARRHQVRVEGSLERVVDQVVDYLIEEKHVLRVVDTD